MWGAPVSALPAVPALRTMGRNARGRDGLNLFMPGLGADRLTRLRAAHLEVETTKAKIV